MAVLVAALGLLLGGCASTPRTVRLPYSFPATATATPDAPAPEAVVAEVTDSREDRSIDMFLNQSTSDFIRQALASEFEAAGVFKRVATQRTPDAVAPIAIDVRMNDLSWAVPNHAAMVKTAFWTSFLTGGLGGLAYGATDTPVFGRASLGLRITEVATGRVIFDDTVEAVHEEKVAKLKSDTLETRARVIAAALKLAFGKANAEVLKARQAVANPASAATPAT